MRWSFLAVLLGACTHADEVPVGLADLAHGTLTLETSADASAGGFDIDVKLDFGIPECARLDPSVTITLDGTPLGVISRGKYIGGIPSCEIPWFDTFRSPSAAGTSELVLADGAMTMTATVAALRTARAFSIAGTPHPGADVRFVWSVPTDTVGAPGGVTDWATPVPGVQWAPTTVGTGFDLGSGYRQGGLAIDGTTLVASIPATAAPGAGVFFFLPLFAPTFTTCTGIGRCEAVPPVPGRIDATIAP